MVVAKNYLTEAELAQLSRLVNAYLDVAEDMAIRKLPMTMQDWETRLNRYLATDRERNDQVVFEGQNAASGGTRSGLLFGSRSSKTTCSRECHAQPCHRDPRDSG